MDHHEADHVSRAVTRAAFSRVGAGILLLLLAAPCCFWGALRALARGMNELWAFAPIGGFVLLAASAWTGRRLRIVLGLAGAAALVSVYLMLR